MSFFKKCLFGLGLIALASFNAQAMKRIKTEDASNQELRLIADDKTKITIPAAIVHFASEGEPIFAYFLTILNSKMNDAKEGIKIPGFNKEALFNIVSLLSRYTQLLEKNEILPEREDQLQKIVATLPKIEDHAVELMRLFRRWQMPAELCQAVEYYIINNLETSFILDDALSIYLVPIDELKECDAKNEQLRSSTNFSLEEQIRLLLQCNLNIEKNDATSLQHLLEWIKITDSNPDLMQSEIWALYSELLEKVAQCINANINNVMLAMPNLTQILKEPSLQALADKLLRVMRNSVQVRHKLHSHEAFAKRVIPFKSTSNSAFRNFTVLDQDHMAMINWQDGAIEILDAKTMKVKHRLKYEFFKNTDDILSLHSLANKQLIIRDDHGQLYKIDWNTGKTFWSNQHFNEDGFIILNNTIALAAARYDNGPEDDAEVISVVDLETGRLLHKFTISPCNKIKKLNDHQIIFIYESGIVTFDVLTQKIVSRFECPNHLTFEFPEIGDEMEDEEGNTRLCNMPDCIIVDDNHILVKAWIKTGESNDAHLLLVNTTTGKIENEMIVNFKHYLFAGAYLGSNLLYLPLPHDYNPSVKPEDEVENYNRIYDIRTGKVIAEFGKTQIAQSDYRNKPNTCIISLDDEHFAIILVPDMLIIGEEKPINIRIYNTHGQLLSQIIIPAIYDLENIKGIQLLKIDPTQFIFIMKSANHLDQDEIFSCYIPELSSASELISFMKEIK